MKKIPSLVSILFEEEEKSTGKIGDAPRGDAVDKSTNVKDVDPIEIVNQLLSGDDNAPIVKSTQGQWFATNGAQAKEWVEKIGPEEVASRIKTLASKIPTSGLPKSVMPFLPGPEDAKGSVDQVVDALSPGGKFNIDTHNEAVQKNDVSNIRALKKRKVNLKRGKFNVPPAPNTFVGMDDAESKEFMTSGHEENDGNKDDDDIKVVKGGSVPASDAIPTQSNILIYKALGMAMNPKNQIAGGDLDAWAGTNGEILDGHHRWAATMLNDPSASLGTAGQVDLQSLGDEKRTLKFLTALGNALGNATKTESRKTRDDLLIEKWQRLAGILK
tara:strand:- start:1642 stop:2628 length:987 start_codon:yes stop_codon:yes gene_type:complete